MPSSPNSVVVPAGECSGGITDGLTPIRLDDRMENQQQQKQLKVPLRAFRNQILVQGSIIGMLCGIFAKIEHSDDAEIISQTVGRTAAPSLMGELMKEVMVTARTLGINLASACDMKIDLNIKKYPADLCQVCIRYV